MIRKRRLYKSKWELGLHGWFSSPPSCPHDPSLPLSQPQSPRLCPLIILGLWQGLGLGIQEQGLVWIRPSH